MSGDFSLIEFIYLSMNIQTHVREIVINITFSISQNNAYILDSTHEIVVYIFKRCNTKKAIRINSHSHVIQALIWPNGFLICIIDLCIWTEFKVLLENGHKYLQMLLCIWAYLVFNVQKSCACALGMWFPLFK